MAMAWQADDIYLHALWNIKASTLIVEWHDMAAFKAIFITADTKPAENMMMLWLGRTFSIAGNFVGENHW